MVFSAVVHFKFVIIGVAVIAGDVIVVVVVDLAVVVVVVDEAVVVVVHLLYGQYNIAEE